jgi:hypothetical protein
MGIRSQALSSGPTLDGAALRLWCRTRPDRAAASVELRHGNTRTISSSVELCPTNPPGARREVLADLVELAGRHATQHQELHQTAVEHRRKNMAQRTYANQNASPEVARVLRSDMVRE